MIAGPPDSVDYLRRAQLFTQALWGRSPDIHYQFPNPANRAPVPQIQQGRIGLPQDALHADPHPADLARAMAAHAAAHLEYSTQPFDRGGLKPRQCALVELIEDARVEALARQRFPGLGALWRRFLRPPTPELTDFTSLMTRLAHGLFDPAYEDPHAWVRKGQRLFHRASESWRDPGSARALGLILATDLGQMRIAMNEGEAVVVSRYRDDNTHLWYTEREVAEAEPSVDVVELGASVSARLREADGGAALPLAAAGANAGTGVELRQGDTSGVLELNLEDTRAGVEGYSYPEWDYRIDCLKEHWVTLREIEPGESDADRVAETLARHRWTVERLYRQLEFLQYRTRRRLKRQLDGDAFDRDALVSHQVAMRARQTPDARIYERHHLHSEQELSLLVLLDLSASTNDPLPGAPGTCLLDVTRDAAILLSDALQRIGHRFAIHGFNSNGRAELRYQQLLRFGERVGQDARRRLGGVKGEYSTRIGAAIRHALHHLQQESATHRLLLVVTDGEPSDVDVFDRRLLIEDARVAVQEARAQGVLPFCLSLDREADAYITHIFGAGHFEVLDQVVQLPHKLPELYFRIARAYLG